MQKAKILGLLAAVLIISAAVLGIYFWKTQEKSEAKVKETIIPTVFVHGYKGTVNSFGHMLNRFGYESGGKKIAMRIVVAENGELDVSGGIGKYEKDGDSAVQILFEDNRASLARQTIWLQKAMRYLREYEQVKTINFVGHSMGGLAILSYLEKTPVDAAYPVPQKFIAIATPFAGIDKANYFKLQKDPAAHDLKVGSAALQLLVKEKLASPKTFKF
ncbi:alpha/beta hydrolase [Listeria aquatica]|uniref:alpha/beta hydrolase n=1 Tax=Listeria aquatica TaxID=1494960 RepID=UPI0031F4C14B